MPMMNNFVKRTTKGILMRHPAAGIRAVQLARPLRFWPERLGWRGWDTGSGNGRPSIVFFTHYRCASMMLVQRLNDLIEGLGYRQINYQGYVHPWPIEKREKFQRDREEHERVGRFVAQGRFYAPLRYFVDIPHLDQYKVLLVLRDPRDVLVSRYYSERFAHVRLDKGFLDHCRKVEDMTIEEFVVGYTDDVGAHYRLFMEHAADLEHAHVVPYEEVIADFAGFLRGVNEYASLGRSEEEILEIAGRESFSVSSEDKYSHKRSVKARNFEEKLPAETIAVLNRELGDILDHFGWER
jgi:hypothetical protein